MMEVQKCWYHSSLLFFKGRPNRDSIHNNTPANYTQSIITSSLHKAQLSGSLPLLPIVKICRDEAMTLLSNVLNE